MAEFDVKLYQKVLKPSFLGLRAVEQQHTENWAIHGWYSASENRTGTGTYDSELAYDGLTLYASLGDSPSASLITMSGEEVHRWQLPFREAWPDSPHVPRPVPENRIHWRCLRLFPNGDLLVNYNGIADSPAGYGLVKMDKDSRLIWRYSDRAHHEFDVDEAGNVYTLVHSIRHERVKGAPHLRTPFIEDSVAVLSPDGKEQKRVAIFDAFVKSKFRDYLLSIRSNTKGDHTHANKVAVIPPGFAKKNTFCAAGDVLISLRNPNLLAILDLKQEKIVWAARGIWEKQHEPDPLENGNILIFDNRGKYSAGGRSRILEWRPRTGAVVWSYRGTSENRFHSFTRGYQQLLPNGNVLVTESDAGRIFEITRRRQIVWEFFNPVRSGEKADCVAVVCSAARFDPKNLTFLSPVNTAQILDNSSNTQPSNTKPTVR
jgi:hypothetical protein